MSILFTFDAFSVGFSLTYCSLSFFFSCLSVFLLYICRIVYTFFCLSETNFSLFLELSFSLSLFILYSPVFFAYNETENVIRHVLHSICYRMTSSRIKELLYCRFLSTFCQSIFLSENMFVRCPICLSLICLYIFIYQFLYIIFMIVK